jgi:hypothetical protein
MAFNEDAVPSRLDLVTVPEVEQRILSLNAARAQLLRLHDYDSVDDLDHQIEELREIASTAEFSYGREAVFALNHDLLDAQGLRTIRGACPAYYRDRHYDPEGPCHYCNQPESAHRLPV